MNETETDWPDFISLAICLTCKLCSFISDGELVLFCISYVWRIVCISCHIILKTLAVSNKDRQLAGLLESTFLEGKVFKSIFSASPHYEPI